MKRREFIKTASVVGVGLGLSLVSTSAIAAAQKKKAIKAYKKRHVQPHIIFIMADQFRGDSMGCMGHPTVKTPCLDKLAAEGTLFINGYSSTPSSTPARAGLLTGLSPWHHGMLGYGVVAQKYKYEMPQMLRDLGYHTHGIGKMHWHPQRALHGFHATELDESGRVESDGFISDYRQWFKQQAPDKKPDVTGIGWNDHGAKVYQLDEKLHPTFWTGQQAYEFIRNYEADQPLFLKVSFARPHSPYDPPQRFLDQYKDVEIPMPAIGDWCKEYSRPKNPSTSASDAPFGNFGSDYACNSRRHYYASISFVDEQVGELIELLKKRKMYDNALICFTADHGDMMGDHYHWRKTYPYEGSVKVPYIVKFPQGIQQDIGLGKKIDAPVELRDFLPTFLDAARGRVPEDMDGMSLIELAYKGNDIWRQYIDLEHATCYAPQNYWCALTDGKIKYVWQYYTGEEQLFDLEADPTETHDCAQDPSSQRLLYIWRKKMVEHLSERGEEFVKDGKLVRRTKTLLYSPHYPRQEAKT